ncbi:MULTISPECIES: hypothetical protein [Arthrobacter]|uniref:RDD family protein n=2 Tax=Arthrobacter TaxID=1663 RepID=A0ABU9KFM5_9MICC|nr:hypothetical protein [Arthrobacter sp. YJM1]MDP5225685.1 hypothetical protein [Arthrobacter sp. YJM1]
MPNHPPLPSGRRAARRLIFAADLLVLLCPLVYLLFGPGTQPAAYLYFILGNAAVVLSLPLLWALENGSGKNS